MHNHNQKKSLLQTPKPNKEHSSQSASASSETDNHLKRKIPRRHNTKSDIPLSNKYSLLTPEDDMVVDTHPSPPPPESTSLKLSQTTEPEMNHDRSSSQDRSSSHSGPPPPPSAPLVKASKTASSEKPDKRVDEAFKFSGRPSVKPPPNPLTEKVKKQKSIVKQQNKEK